MHLHPVVTRRQARKVVHAAPGRHLQPRPRRQIQKPGVKQTVPVILEQIHHHVVNARLADVPQTVAVGVIPHEVPDRAVTLVLINDLLGQYLRVLPQVTVGIVNGVGSHLNVIIVRNQRPQSVDIAVGR